MLTLGNMCEDEFVRKNVTMINENVFFISFFSFYLHLRLQVGSLSFLFIHTETSQHVLLIRQVVLWFWLWNLIQTFLKFTLSKMIRQKDIFFQGHINNSFKTWVWEYINYTANVYRQRTDKLMFKSVISTLRWIRN